MTPRIGSLFTGYGGLDLAVEMVTGAQPAWFVEYDDAPSQILAHHWPDIPNYGDVTAIDWSEMPPVDILTGGYPCQPFSAAGRRKGTDDDRHLWPYVREAIRHLRPRITILENVAGHRSLGLDRVLGDMAEDGLHVQWTSIRASDIGAPHHRERLFILAAFPDTEGARWDHGQAPHDGQADRKIDAPEDDHHPAADPEGGTGSISHRDDVRPRGAEGRQRQDTRRSDISPDPGRQRRESGELTVRPAPEIPELDRSVSALPDTDRQRLTGRRANAVEAEGAHESADRYSAGIDFGPYAPAVRRWERLTRPAPPPTELNRNGKPRLNAAFAEWMMGIPDGHVTNVPGLTRAEQLKAIGNGVCPPQAAAAIHQLLTPH